MPVVLLVSLVSLAISVAVTAAVRRGAVARGLFDSAQSSRKIHQGRVPRLGGVGIVSGVYGAIGVALLVPSVRSAVSEEWPRVAGLLLAALAVALVGLYDDLHGARARTKLAVQLGAAALLYVSGFRIEQVENPLGGEIVLGVASLPLTLLWVAGVSNAINLIDGLDGLAGGICVAGGVAAFCVGAHGADLPAMLMAVAVVGGVLGFLVYNVHPASIFMGDAGSLFLGFLLAALALRPHGVGHGVGGPHLVAMAVVLGIPIADTTLAILRRIVRGTPVFCADREHLHHRLVDSGLTQRHAVLVLWTVAALLALAGVNVAAAAPGSGVTVVLVALAAVVALKLLGMLTFTAPGQGERRRSNRALYRAVRLASRRIRLATQVADVRGELMRVAPGLKAQALWLRLGADAGVVSGRGALRSAPGVRTAFALDGAEPTAGALEVSWADPQASHDRDVEIALEQLCQEVSTALKRLQVPVQPTVPLRGRVLGVVPHRDRRYRPASAVADHPVL